MANVFETKYGSELPDWVDTLSDSLGPVDLTGATIELKIKPRNGVTITTIVGSPDPDQVANKGVYRVLRPNWDGITPLQPGYYYCETHVTFSGGELAIWPIEESETYVGMLIHPSLLS